MSSIRECLLNYSNGHRVWHLAVRMWNTRIANWDFQFKHSRFEHTNSSKV